jgi:hypothetical protein
MRLEEVSNNFIDGIFQDYWWPFIKDMPNAQYLTGFDMDLDVWEYLMYFTYEPITRYVYNREYSPEQRFEKNMDRACEKYGIGMREKVIIGMKNKCKEVQRYYSDHKITDWDPEYGDLLFHVEYLWETEGGTKTCDVCHSYDGKNIEEIENLHPHFNCRCMIKQHTWWTDKNGKVVKESEKIL